MNHVIHQYKKEYLNKCFKNYTNYIPGLNTIFKNVIILYMKKLKLAKRRYV